jgi:hypothetical protein
MSNYNKVRKTTEKLIATGAAVGTFLLPSILAAPAQAARPHKKNGAEVHRAYRNLLSVNEAEKVVEGRIKNGTTAIFNGTLVISHPEGNGGTAYTPTEHGGTYSSEPVNDPTYVTRPLINTPGKYDPSVSSTGFNPYDSMFGWVNHRSHKPEVTLVKFDPLTMKLVPDESAKNAISQVKFMPLKGGGNEQFSEFDFNRPLDPAGNPLLDPAGNPEVVAEMHPSLK